MYPTRNVYRHHDTFPHPEGIPCRPELIPDLTPEPVEFAADAGASICGDPDGVPAAVRADESVGVDRLVLDPGCDDRANTLKTIELFGKHVVPRFDTDPEHRTTRFRHRT
ncbi:hypothetical protein [Embleya sp. AB8]|uniref:hypothetical protein n=1 Tax=Embleya sp. AB8 TaxID=3156304 RepID=UPI003C7081BC